MALQNEPLFLGPTRPTMYLGVTLDFFLVNFGIAGFVLIAVGNPLWMGLVIPFHAIAYLLCMNEPRMLELLALWGKTKGACLNRFWWQASTCSPLEPRRKPRRG